MQKRRTFLGFPYDPKYEEGYNQNLVRRLYKPLLVVVCGVLLFVSSLLVTLFFNPAYFGSAQHMPGLLAIHAALFGATLLAILISVVARRQLFLRPRLYLSFVHSYAFCICIWGTVMASFANYSPIIFSGVIYISLLLALVAQLKPWQALLLFPGNFLLYVVLIHFWKTPAFDPLNYYNVVLASALSILISAIMYHYSVRVYYNNVIITEQNRKIRKINQELAGKVHTDDLTGIYNRRYFDEELPAKFEAMLQTSLACVMMIDVDFFKVYNDTYGHQQGDRALQRVTTLVDEVLPRNESYFVRYGGEEFILLIAVENTPEARRIATRICSRVQEAAIPSQKVQRKVLTVSIGYSVCDKTAGAPLAEMAHRADKALYQAKDKGRNTAVLYEGDAYFLGNKQSR